MTVPFTPLAPFPHWQPRPGTTDAQIISHVYTRNCYGLPDDMRDYVVVDVGAHVGAFTIACLDRGARVWAYEPDPDNFQLLMLHVAAHPSSSQVEMADVAVGYFGEIHLPTRYPSRNGLLNSGGLNIFASEGDETIPGDSVTLEQILSKQIAGRKYGAGKMLLKLDCEGSEHRILHLSEKAIQRFDYIIGEAHDATGLDPAFPPTQLLNAQSVVRRLSQLGYRVRYKNARPKGLALFSAARRDPSRPLRILWVGDAVAATGFSRCTHAACDALHAAGYDIHVLGMNHYGDPHPYPYPIYPARKGGDWSGVLRLPELVEKLDPDLIVGLNDAWNVRDYLDELNDSGVQLPPIMFWLAADGENQAAGRELDDLTHVVAWTQFGVDEFRKGGYRGPASIVPLGVDCELFRPLDKQECRAKVLPASLGIPPDAFVVGFVGRNQPRKRIDLLLRYFAAWLEGPYATATTADPEKAYLYLHVAPTGESGTDIRSLTRYYGLEGRVIVSHPANMGEGIADSVLPYVYGAMDLFLTTTQGEGWGLPVLEAMACGTLCAVPDWSALGEWARPAAYMIPCTSTALSAPLNGKAYTIGGVPDERGTVDAIQWAYDRAQYQQEAGDNPEKDFRSLGLRLARSLSWEKTGEGMVREVERLLGVRKPDPVPGE